MGRFKLVVIDLDGTLLTPAGEVTARVKTAIHRALGAGLLVCFATGRNWTESKDILETLEHYPTAVFVGGAMVVDTGRRVTLHRTMMEPGLAMEVCRLLEEAGQPVLALEDLGEAGVQYVISTRAAVNEATRVWMEVTGAKLRKLPSLADYGHERTVRLGICAEPDVVRVVKGSLEKSFASRLLCQNLLVPTYGVEVLEIFDPAVNKWEGVLHVARRHGIEAHEIVAIGDDINDLPMIRNAGLGVAMGNARPEVREAAGRVIGTNREDGLAIFLDELVDLHEVEPVGSGDGGGD